MEEKGMKKRLLHFKKKFVPALSGAVMGVMLMSTTCFAAGDTSAVTQPLENLKTLLAKGLREAGQTVNNAFRTFADKPEVDYSQKEKFSICRW